MTPKDRWSGPTPLSRLVKGAIDPVIAKRGFGAADLIGAWDEIVGPRYASSTRPEQIKWPQQRGGAAVLTVGVDSGQAVYLQHELDQLLERVNGFLGYEAIAEIRLVQKNVRRAAMQPHPEMPLPEAESLALDASVADIDDDKLRSALRKLGEAVVRKRLARP
jgi:hypothetical protein